MPNLNLTRDEARERARLLSVDSYAIVLDLTVSTKTFPSTTTVRFSCSAPGASTFIDLIAPAVREITLNDRAVDPAMAYDGARLTLDGLGADNELRVVADCAFSRTGEGLHRFVDPVDGETYLYTQFEVADARRVFACWDQPDLKSTFAFTVRTPGGWQVVSNRPTPEPEPAGEDVMVWRFARTPRIPTYVAAVVAGPYHRVLDQYRRKDAVIPLGLFCRKSLAEHLDPALLFEVTRQGFDFYFDSFDYPYPFDKYDQLFVPEFNAGAMENAGCVTILEDYLFRSKVTDAEYQRRAETQLHELAHMWFGDLVTMRWWDDLWLNESFATYISYLCQADSTRWSAAWATFAYSTKGWAYRQDQLPSTHPIVAEIRDLQDVEVNFDGITYAKGASVLKQLVAWVGRDRFLAGLRRYFHRHEWDNATLRDLLTAVEETSGRDLGQWAGEWLETAGVNTLQPELEVDGAGTFTSFAVLQTAPDEYPTLRSHRLAIGLYARTPDGLARVDRVELDVIGPRTEVPQLVGKRRPDLMLLNDDDLTYGKIRFDDRSLATLMTAIGELPELLPRALCWAAAWDMTRDAEIAAREFLELVLSGVGREPDVSVVQTLQRQVKTALDVYADPGYRPKGLLRLADAGYRFLHDAGPGSDHQLAWARSFASAAASDRHFHFLRGLLDSFTSVAGLAVDTDLRWAFLQRLVAMGKATDADIESELDRDNTAAGRRRAAACTAARPTAAAKEEAWRSVVERDDLPNAILGAVIGGFMQPDQRELLVPYVDRYLGTLNEVWANRSQEMARLIVTGLYPAYIVEQSALDRTDEFLDTANPAPALRRLVLEGRDGVARALRAQACDRSAAADG